MHNPLNAVHGIDFGYCCEGNTIFEIAAKLRDDR